MSRITGIDHPAIAAEDVDRLSDWYCDVLGYEKVVRHDKPVWILRARDRTLLEVMPRDETPRPERTTWTPGWSHWHCGSTDFDAAVAELDEKWCSIDGQRDRGHWRGRVRNFVDPDGNMLQILRAPNTSSERMP